MALRPHEPGTHVGAVPVEPFRTLKFATKASGQVDVRDPFPDPLGRGCDVNFNNHPRLRGQQGLRIGTRFIFERLRMSVAPVVKPGNLRGRTASCRFEIGANRPGNWQEDNRGDAIGGCPKSLRVRDVY